MRPFRFLATVDGYPRFAELTSLARKAEAITILKGCFAEGPFSFSGEHYTITGHDGMPKPAQRPHPPIFLGDGGKRLLTLAARQAQIIGLAPRLVYGDPPRADARSLTAAAGGRRGSAERAHALSREASASIVVVVSPSRKPPDWCCHSRA